MSKGITELVNKGGLPLERTKKKIYKRWWFWVAAFIIVIIVIASNSGGSGSKPTSAAPSTSTKNASHKIGEAFTVGEYQITVSKFSSASTVGDPNGMNSTAKGKYYVVDMTIKNLDKTASTVDSSLFKLKDSSGNEYSSDTTATMEENTNTSFFLDQLNPGVQESGKIVFDMPANLSGLTLEVSGGFASSDSTTLKLN